MNPLLAEEKSTEQATMANKSVTESEQGENLPTVDELVEYACDLGTRILFRRMTALNVFKVMRSGLPAKERKRWPWNFNAKGMDPSWNHRAWRTSDNGSG